MKRVCANPNCGNEFEPKTVSMIYCDAECRKEATNIKAQANYQEKKDLKSGLLKRTCIKCNITKLSRYNKSRICEPCLAQPREDERHLLLMQLGVG